MKIQWYPGHMTKAKRAMSDVIKLVDIIIEMTDARVPEAGRNPEITELGADKSRIIILNKADLANELANNRWASFYKEQGYECMFMDSRKNSGVGVLIKAIENVSKKKRERDAKRGIKNRPVRAMVAGIPNVGKSTLINSVSGRAMAKTGNKPGVTKGNQWIKLKGQGELLDTPGILWPKFEDERVGEMIAFIGSINDMIIDIRELGLELIKWLLKNKPEVLQERFDIKEDDDENAVLIKIAKVRGCTKKGGEPDYDKAATILVNEFRSGKLGRITLQMPQE